jgi:hypothetical protein
MGGNMRHASHQRKKRKRREKRERLQEERKNGEWMHLTISASGETYQLWVKSGESDDAVRAYAQEFMLKTYVKELQPDTQFKELKKELKDVDWIASIRDSLPSVE